MIDRLTTQPAARRSGRAALCIASRVLGFAVCCALAVQASGADAPPPAETHGSLVYDGIPAPPPELAATLGRYLEARQASFLDWLPDGSLLIATRFGNTEQLHRVAAPLGTREQLTWLEEPVTMARAPQTATAAGFVFLADQGGDENAQIYYFRLADHSVRRLTDGRALHGSPVWSRDGRRIAFYGNERDPSSYDIYVAEPDSDAAPRLVHAGDHALWSPLDWSLDGTHLLVLKYVSAEEGTLYTVDVATGESTPLDAGRERKDEKIGIESARFAPDGRGVYVLSDEGSEFHQLRYVDPVAHSSRVMTEEIPWDISAFDVSAEGRYLAYAANVDGQSHLTVIDTVARTDLALPPLPPGVIGRLAFDRDGRRLAFSLATANAPRDVYGYDLERNAVERWTRSEAGPVDVRHFVLPELIRFPSFDRVGGKARQIPAFLYRPGTEAPGRAHAAARSPVLVSLHGGPESQYQPVFDPFIQFLVNELGFAVVAPNVRGSTGYGKTYEKLDDGVLREDAVRDVGALLVWLGLQPDIDRERIFVAGGSYGGYLALAALAAYGDRLHGGIDTVGITNFVTFLEHTSAYRRDLRRAEYGDEREPAMHAFLERISPLSNAASIRAPLLVVQGLNDPRVPPSESAQLVATLRAHGGFVWYLTARDEGHGFRKKANRDAYLLTEAAFLARLAGISVPGARENAPRPR